VEEEVAADSDDSDDGKKEEEEVVYDSEITLSVIKVMREFVETKSGKAKPEDFFEELRMQQLAKLFDHKIRFYIALESLMPNGSMDAKEVGRDEVKGSIEKVLAATKIPVSDVLSGFDTYLSVNEKAVRSFPMVLKVIYDEEWAAEDDLMKHYRDEEGAGGPGFETAKKSGAPFIKWLETADDSDDDEDDDDDEDSD